jgi:solute carrier family 25 protein 33/36
VQVARKVYEADGIRGFYRGLSASYYGIAETVIHFVIYEILRAKLVEHRAQRQMAGEQPNKLYDFLEYMGAGALAKAIATCVGYPHEVARTRMREEGNTYQRFWQTLGLVVKEEGVRGVYRGLTTQLIKHIPNMGIMMSTYEAVVHFCHAYGS